MANYNISESHKATGELWVNLAIPASGSYLTLTNGEPDATQNPNALHLGMTNEGATMTITRESEDEFVDNFKAPVLTDITQTGASITASLVQVANIDILTALSSGVGTKVTAAGKKVLTLGESPLVYQSCAIISRLRSDPTKFMVTHLYNAINLNEIALQLSRQNRTALEIELKGYQIPSRPASDSFGAIWWQAA